MVNSSPELETAPHVVTSNSIEIQTDHDLEMEDPTLKQLSTIKEELEQAIVKLLMPILEESKYLDPNLTHVNESLRFRCPLIYPNFKKNLDSLTRILYRELTRDTVDLLWGKKWIFIFATSIKLWIFLFPVKSNKQQQSDEERQKKIEEAQKLAEEMIDISLQKAKDQQEHIVSFHSLVLCMIRML